MKSLASALKNAFEKYFYIPPLDLADVAETNRHRNCVWSFVGAFLILLWAPICLLFFKDNLRGARVYLGFILITFLDTSLSFCLSLLVKNVSRQKAWLLKNIPIYVVFCWGMGGSCYIFYAIQDQASGVMCFFISAAIMLSVFSLSLPFFCAVMFAGAAVMAPGVLEVFGPFSFATFVLSAVFILFLAFYKRNSEKQFLALLKNQKKLLEAKTFGNFTLLYENKVVKFSRVKSSELLAYLVYKNGSSANTKELISVLYGGFGDSERYGSSLRSLVSDIKRSLADLGVKNFFIAEYNNFRVNPEAVRCDFYDFLAGDEAAQKKFTGQFMSQYGWAEGAAEFLERKLVKGAS